MPGMRLVCKILPDFFMSAGLPCAGSQASIKNASVDSPLRQPFPCQQKSPLSKDSGRMGEPVTPGPHRLFC